MRKSTRLIVNMATPFIFTPMAIASFDFQPRLLKGQQVPGAAVGVVYDNIMSSGVNRSAEIALTVSFTGPGVNASNNAGAIRINSSGQQLIARKGDAFFYPGGDSVITDFSQFTGIIHNDLGQSMFVARTPTQSNQLLLAAGSDIFPVIPRSPAPPGTPAGLAIQGAAGFTLQDSGVFSTGAILSPSPAGFNTAIYAGDPTNPSLVAVTGQAAPGLPAGVTLREVGGDSVYAATNDAGNIAFFANLAGPSVIAGVNNSALFSGTLLQQSVVARTGGQAVGLEAGVNHSGFFSTPRISSEGAISITSILTGTGVSSTNDTASFFGLPGALTVFAREGSPAAGFAPGITYRNVPLFAPNAGGYAVSSATLNGVGINASNRSVIYAGRNDSFLPVVREQDPALHFGPGIVFSTLGASVASPTEGSFAFIAIVSGPGITGSNDLTLQWYDPATGFQTLLREGDLLTIAPGDLRTVSFINLNADAVSDFGRITVTLSFTDGSAGIFTTQVPLPIPEPAQLGLLAAGAATLSHRPRRKS